MDYKTFKQKSEALLATHEECFANFPWQNASAYADWVAQTYYYVCHSTRLLALAASRLGQDEDQLHLRMIAHMGEEQSHEKLAMNDLKNLKFKLADFPEMAETKCFYQSQYFYIEHGNPKALFGYILSLEAIAARKGGGIYKKLGELYGTKAATFWKVHGEEDVDHLDKLYKELSALKPEDFSCILESLEQSCRIYQVMMEAIVLKHKNARAWKKAS
jgi:hypothetical protein